MVNDQRGCVKGPPTCDCYHTPGRDSLSPDFCRVCGRCRLHCPGSATYEPPREGPYSRFLYRQGAPITKTVKEHKFRSLGFCHCEVVEDSDLEKEAAPFPGAAEPVYHIVCGKRYMPLEEEKADEH